MDFQQLLKEKYFVLTETPNFIAIFVFAAMASSFKTKLSSSVKRDAILTSVLKSTNSLGYRELREPIRARENGYIVVNATINLYNLLFHFD